MIGGPEHAANLHQRRERRHDGTVGRRGGGADARSRGPDGAGNDGRARRRARVHVKITQRFDAVAEWRVGLNVDLPGAIEIREVIDVERTQVDFHCREDVLQRYPDRLGLVAVDVGLDLRRVDSELREDVHQPRILGGDAHHHVGGIHKRRQTDVAAILELELETAEVADAVDRRRVKRKDLRLRNLTVEGVVQALLHRERIVRRARVGMGEEEDQLAPRRGLSVAPRRSTART